ncbi:hypothetical protein ACIBUY_04735 [Streptomyces sp. NPDC050085]|uniref:hypothetical protein n=1 Tax=Streptomyces sp. NPDC050085 TaxID=3365600 RepID=UPI003787A6B0
MSIRVRALAAAALTTALVFSGASAYAASTSTQLSNGTLYFSAQDGAVVSGNGSLFYGATKYKKTGGSKVNVYLKMSTSESVFSSPLKSVSSGQTVDYSFGGKSKAKYAPDCRATGLMDASTGGPYYTPTVNFC